MAEEELRDHCKDLLIAIAEDLDEEDPPLNSQKNRGVMAARTMMRESARLHADGRVGLGFVHGDFRLLHRFEYSA